MLYAFLCTDKPNSLALRMETRPPHVEWLNEINAVGQLTFAGPFLDDAGQATGSLVVVEAETLEAAQALSAADPYAKAGLFETVEVKAWTWVFNKPEA